MIASSTIVRADRGDRPAALLHPRGADPSDRPARSTHHRRSEHPRARLTPQTAKD